MRKYEYKNATVYITIPNEQQIENIKKATEKYARQVLKERMKNGHKRKSN